MRQRTVATAAIAASIMLVILGFWPGENGNGRVYGMSDVPELLRNARTLHIVGYTYVPPVLPDGQERTKVPIETWIDRTNGCQRMLSSSYSMSSKGIKISRHEYVVNGEFAMQTNHTERSVKYERMSPFQQRLNMVRSFDQVLKQYFGDPEHLEEVHKTTQERIGDLNYDVWEAISVSWANAGFKIKIKCWIASDSGDIGRYQIWLQKNDVQMDWQLAMDIKIERDTSLPPDIFDVQPPEGYMLENTKETADTRELVSGGLGLNDLSVSTHIAFLLDDGSLLVGWSSRDSKSQQSQERLFTGLSFGGRLPKLPIEIHMLKATTRMGEIHYTGYHLTFTQKNDRYYEWSLYVPDSRPPAQLIHSGYQVLHRFNPANRPVRGKGTFGIGMYMEISNKQEFDTLVSGAMAELSDDGKVSAHVTYANVMSLSRRIRAELAAQKVPISPLR